MKQVPPGRQLPGGVGGRGEVPGGDEAARKIRQPGEIYFLINIIYETSLEACTFLFQTFNPENGEHSVPVTSPLPGPWFMLAHYSERGRGMEFAQGVRG